MYKFKMLGESIHTNWIDTKKIMPKHLISKKLNTKAKKQKAA